MTETTRGNPVGGAVAGAVIGGAIFRSGWGALGGAATGALISNSRNSQERTIQVNVRFDDGGHDSLIYKDASPFRPGDRIELTPDGPIKLQG